MINAIYCEFLKLKRSKLSVISLICILIPIIISHSSSYYDHLIVLKDYFNNIYVFSWIFFVILFTLIAGTIFCSEYRDNTIKNIFIYPISRKKLFVAKIVTLMCIIVLTYVLSLLFSLISLLLVNHRLFSSELLLNVFKSYGILIVGFICFLSLISAMCILIKKVTVPLIVSMCCILYLFGIKQFSDDSYLMIFCPVGGLLQLSLYMLQGQEIPTKMIYLTCGGLIISLILGFAISIYIFNKRDIDN